MINLDKYKIYLGDFHTHWYWDKENPTVFLAGMNHLGLDFVLLQDGIKRAEECDHLAASYHTNFRFFPGQEIGYSFAHIVTWLDSIQFAFEPSIYREPRGYGTNYEFALAKTKRGNEVMTWYTPQTGDNQVRKLSETAFLDVIRDEPGKLTKYRFSIPWTSLKPFVPREGAQFKFAFVINDSDGLVIPQRCVLFYGGNIGECKDTSLAHSVTLVKLC